MPLPKDRVVLFITHAEVAIDPVVPVPDWGLSDIGRRRHRAFNATGPIQGITSVYCSAERKARDGALILVEAIGITPRVREALGENDRSATGYMPPAEFEAAADLFFAHPDQSFRGWERATDAQTRVVACVESILADDETNGDIALVAHGGVGALLLCHLLGEPISRGRDQPGRGGGNHFAFHRDGRALLHGWRSIGSAA